MNAMVTIEHEVLPYLRGWFAAFNRADWQGFGDFMAADIVSRMPALGSEWRGRDAVIANYQQWRDQFATLEGTVTDGFGEPGRIAVQVVWTGTTRRKERQVTFPACMLFRLDDHEITEIIDYYDQLTYRRQMGQSLRG